MAFRLDKDLFGHEVLGGNEIEIPDQLLPNVPNLIPGYIFSLETLRLVLNWIFIGSRFKQGFYLFGPSGTGKTSVVEQAAARLGIPVHYTCATEGLEFFDLVGQFQITGPNQMTFVYGPLTKAYRDGHIFLLDEMDRWDVPAAFYGILEGKPLNLPNGEVINRHPDFRLFATGNTGGGGDWSGKYRNTKHQNEALMQRFDLAKVMYPPVEVEEQVISTYLSEVSEFDEDTIKDYARKMVQVASLVRKSSMQDSLSGNEIEIDFSVRTLLSWAENMVNFSVMRKYGVSPVDFGLDRAVLCRATDETAAAVRQIVKDVFNI